MVPVPGSESIVAASCVPCRLRHSHHTSRPNDSASSARATTSAAWVTRRRQELAAATVSTIPCVAATTLRQKRGGSGSRIHGSGHPAARNA